MHDFTDAAKQLLDGGGLAAVAFLFAIWAWGLWLAYRSDITRRLTKLEQDYQKREQQLLQLVERQQKTQEDTNDILRELREGQLRQGEQLIEIKARLESMQR